MTDCKQIAKNYIKTLSSDEIENLSKHPDFEYEEKWIIYYTYAKKRYVVNTCQKLNISEPQFFIILREALTKVYYIKDLKNYIVWNAKPLIP